MIDNSPGKFVWIQPPRKKVRYVAKWWMKPICWVVRRPTEFWR